MRKGREAPHPAPSGSFRPSRTLPTFLRLAHSFPPSARGGGRGRRAVGGGARGGGRRETWSPDGARLPPSRIRGSGASPLCRRWHGAALGAAVGGGAQVVRAR